MVTWGPPDRMTDRQLPASSLASGNNFFFLQGICTKNIKELDDDYEAQICGSYRRGKVPCEGGHSYQRPPVNYKSKGPPLNYKSERPPLNYKSQRPPLKYKSRRLPLNFKDNSEQLFPRNCSHDVIATAIYLSQLIGCVRFSVAVAIRPRKHIDIP